MGDEQFGDIRELVRTLRELGVVSYKYQGLEVILKELPIPFDEKEKNPIIKEPDFYDTDTWANDKGSN